MIYTIGSSIMRLMTFLLLPIYTNILDANGQEWYGNYVLVFTTIAFLRICYSQGIGDSFLNSCDSISSQGFNLNFKKMWDFYFSYCDAGFKSKNIDLIQFSLCNK